MSSNYEWQKQYTKQRIGDAQRLAEAHRAARAADQKKGLGLLAALRAVLARVVPRRRRDIPVMNVPERRQTPAG
jgi:hypothetical protein